MAKKKTKRKKRDSRRTIISLNGSCKVALADWIREDSQMLRSLHHRVVDLLACHRSTNWMIRDVEDRLAAMSVDLIDAAIGGLIVEAYARREEVSRG